MGLYDFKASTRTAEERVVCGFVWEPPSPSTLSEANDYLARTWGRNLFGDPLYRVVWSGNRLERRLKYHVDMTKHGEMARRVLEARWLPKYHKPREVERYVLELYRPPSFYGDPETWDAAAKEDNYLPFPRRGDYERVEVMFDENGRFMPLTSEILDYWVRRDRKRIGDLAGEEKFSESEIVALEVKRETQAEETILDRVRDNGPAMLGRPFVSMAGESRGEKSGEKRKGIHKGWVPELLRKQQEAMWQRA